MKLIIDSGSTKTQWTVLNGKEVVEMLYTVGINPYYMDSDEIKQVLKKELNTGFTNLPVKEIYYFGTGCSTVANCNLIKSILADTFQTYFISMNHDLTGAAIALLKDEKGIACILGTGSNSCLWDGQKILENVPSLGYLLGDEGSGTYLGKLILKAFLSGEADKGLTEKFYAYTQMNFTEILHKIYKEVQSNRWMASLTKFASAHIDEPFIKALVRQNFEDFLKEQVFKYSGFRELPISFVGSVAYYFQDVLMEVLSGHQITPGRILQTPMKGLIEYYSE